MEGPLNTRVIPEWRQADDEDMIKVRPFQEAELRDAKFGDGKWACSLCTAFNATARVMATHLEQT